MSASSNTRPHLPSDPGDILASGDQVGRYQLISMLANGGMGQVWTARPTGSGFARTIALKLVRSEMSGDENYARMFIDEATVASSIHHPNVCETYELGRDGDRLYMAMEWVAGDSLAGLLRQKDALVALDLRIAARIIADASAGLHAAHETVGPDGTPLGVVHRDISPPNILISMQGQVKVSDFGIAKARYQLHERTKTGEVKGKFAYIPPEQITGRGVDRRADIYAMGCVLYVATLGLRPFGNGAAALPKILHNQYQLPTKLRADYPPALEAIIVKALAPTPDARFATAEEMQFALEDWLASTGRLVTASDVAKYVKERINRDVRVQAETLLSQNRVAPELLMNRLGSKGDETPTAGSGLTQAPAALWRGKPMAKPAAAVEVDPHPSDATLTFVDRKPLPSEPAPRAPIVATRPSDATALVDFAPMKVSAAAPMAPASTLPTVHRQPEPTPAFRSSWSAYRVFMWTLLVVLAAIAFWLITTR